MYTVLSGLNNRAHIGRNEFEQINWLPVKDRFEQIISSISFKAGPPNTTTKASLHL